MPERDFAGRCVLIRERRAYLAHTWRKAFARHAPDLPVFEVSRTDDGAMTEVVRAAAAIAALGQS